jgi:hypothetical protein
MAKESAMQTHRFLSISLLAAALACPSVASAEPTTVPTEEVATTPTVAPDPAPVDDATRYAEQEKQTPAAANFEGGGRGVYIGGSAVTLVLLVILLVILL